MDVADLCVGCMGMRGPTPVCVECGWDERTGEVNPIALPYRTVLRDQYVFGRALGHGGFGLTYLAWDLNLDLKVAIKEYLPGDLATRSTDRVTVTPYTGQREYFDYGLGSFLDEAKALARFHDHPNIVRVLNFFREHGTGYLVMSYVPGRTFKEYLDANDGRVPFKTAARVLMPVMDALREVHAAGLLHRDISPDNIYLTDAAQVKVIDFGAARYAIGAKSKNLSVVLKPGYAPWEQYQSKGDQGPWTDVYAVGATLYRAVTGLTPPQAPDRIDRDELVPPSQLGYDMPPEAERALLGALAVKTQNRFRTIEELQQPLLAALDSLANRRNERPIPEPVPNPHPSPHPYPLPHPHPLPHPVPTPGPDQIDAIIALLARAADVVRIQVARLVPPLRPPATFSPTMALVSAVVAGLIGLIGSMWSLTELAGLSAGSQIFAAFFPALVLVNKLSLAAALVGNLALLAGAIQWLRSDMRGPLIVWGAAWALVGLAVIGLAWFSLLAPMTGSWSAIAGATQSALMGGALSVAASALVQLGLVIVLVWKSGA